MALLGTLFHMRTFRSKLFTLENFFFNSLRKLLVLEDENILTLIYKQH